MLEVKVQVSTIQCGSRCRKLVQQPVCRLQRSQPPRLAAAVHSSRHYCSASVRQLIAATPCSLAAGTGRRRCGRTAALPPLAMINVDFASPSLVLGIALIGCGVALLQIRNMQREVSRDADIVVAAMISIVGSTLIFQGWRLDPLLLLCQALTTSVAFWYGLEAFKLRQQVTDIGEDDDRTDQPPAPGVYEQSNEPYTSATRSSYLPPGDRQIPPWAVQQQQQQPDYSRWGLPPADQSMQQYDSYFGQQQQQQQVPEGAYAGYEDRYAAPGSSSSLPPLQQPQYGSPGEYPSSSGSYGSGPYGQPTQQQQYGGNNAPPQGGWYAVSPSGAAPPPYGQQPQQGVGSLSAVGPFSPDLAAGPEGSTLPVAAAAAAAGASVGRRYAAPAGYVGDGTVQLPSAGQQQQQQQQQAADGSRPGQALYERVDDWE